MLGRIHSIESMGLVDGPGVRTVVFLQGCRLRCLYCHNPDTWQPDGSGELFSPEQLVEKLLRYRPYYGSLGGVTFSGGEPLLQPQFLLETLRLCKKEGLHTCLDTSGVGCGEYDEILNYTDLVLYDIKHEDPACYEQITGLPMEETDRFLQDVQRKKVPLWLRHVVVPGLTDHPEHLARLRDYAAQIKGVERVELLPYHLLGVKKYESLGIPYRLAGVPAMDAEKTQKMAEEFFGRQQRKDGAI